MENRTLALRTDVPNTPRSSAKQRSLPAYSPARYSCFFPSQEESPALPSRPRTPRHKPASGDTNSFTPFPRQSQPIIEPTQSQMATAYEMQELNHLNHLAINSWVRDKQDNSCRNWTVKIILGLCIGLLSAAVIALSIMLSSHCEAAPNHSAGSTCLATVTMLQTKDAVASCTSGRTNAEAQNTLATKTITSVKKITITETTVSHLTSTATDNTYLWPTCPSCACASVSTTSLPVPRTTQSSTDQSSTLLSTDSQRTTSSLAAKPTIGEKPQALMSPVNLLINSRILRLTSKIVRMACNAQLDQMLLASRFSPIILTVEIF